MKKISVEIEDDECYGVSRTGKVFTLNDNYTEDERQDLMSCVASYIADKLKVR